MIGNCTSTDVVSPTPPGPAIAAARVRGRAQRGFTLIELMITLAVAAVLMVIAVPSFKHLTLSNRLSTSANDLLGAVNTARMQAVKINNYAQFCSNVQSNNGTDTLGTKCSVDPNPGTVVDLRGTTATDLVQAGITSITTPLALNGDVTALRFDGMGIGHAIGSTAPYSGVVAVITANGLSKDNCRIIKMTSGTIVTTVNTDPGYSGCK